MVVVLKFGSSVLRTPSDLPIAVDEIYRHWRGGARILAVVSAFEGVTDRLFQEALALFGAERSSAVAAFVATGEQRTATLLVDHLTRSGIPSRLIEAEEIGLTAEGQSLESEPRDVNVKALEQFWCSSPILVLPGFYGIDARGGTALFGRGGSDMSALFLAAELRADCRLLKDVTGVFDADPASATAAHRFTTLSWSTAIQVAGPLIQAKALRYANARALPFHVGRPNEAAGTLVGHVHDEWAPPCPTPRPLRIVMLGCGVVGRGVYESLRRYPDVFDIGHVLVRDPSKHRDIPGVTTDASVAEDESIDVVVECLGGADAPYPYVLAALARNRYVVTANKALLAAHWAELCDYARGPQRRLWFSAAVGGALPVLETLVRLRAQNRGVRSLGACINSTCGVVLEALADGKTCHEAVSLAQRRGVAEANPARDLSGRDSADKLALMIYAAFGEWLAPETIPTRGIDAIVGSAKGYALVARAAVAAERVSASVAPELHAAPTFLGQARGAENRVEIELASGELIRLQGLGAGRWPTAISVVSDLWQVARQRETGTALT